MLLKKTKLYGVNTNKSQMITSQEPVYDSEIDKPRLIHLFFIDTLQPKSDEHRYERHKIT